MSKQKPIERRSPLTDTQKQILLMTAIRKLGVFKVAKERLKPEHFSREEDRGYGIIWASVLEFYETHEELPDDDYLCAEVESRIEDTDLTEDEINDLDGVIFRAFEKEPEDLKDKVARRYLKQFLEEHVQQETSEMLSGDEVAVALPTLLEDIARKASSLRALESGPLPQPFPDELEEIEALEKFSTGIDLFDHYMNGGHATREVIGFCGPYGSCKTTLAVMLAVLRAWQIQAEWKLGGRVGDPKTVYLTAWEATSAELRLRAMSFAAQIPRKTLEEGNLLDNLSRTGKLKPYEKRRFKSKIQHGIEVKGEWERAQQQKNILNRNLRFLDFSGADKDQRVNASDTVNGVVAAIESDQEQREMPGVGLVLADYAGAAAKRHIEVKGLDPSSQLRHIIGNFPMHCKNLIAVPYNCPVWVFHQLGTEANARAPGQAPKITDTAEARNFFENVDFGFMVGRPNNESLCILTAQKLRRAKRRDDSVLKIDGEMSSVYNASKKYLASSTDGIVERATYGKVADVTTRTGSVSDEGDVFKDAGV